MNVLKKALYGAAPNCYFHLRDYYQITRSWMSGDLRVIKSAAQNIESFGQAFSFTNTYLKSYQIESEIEGLIDLIKSIKPRSYLEIGTADGGTHYLIRQLCPSIKTSIAVDLDIRNRLLIDQITGTPNSYYLAGSSTSEEIEKKVISALNGSQLDVLFIDGDHSYQGVASDFNRYQSLVPKGGLIVFHDIVEDWQQRYGRETNKYTGGVPKFFTEIKDDYQYHTFVEDPDQDGFGIGVIVQR